MVLLIYIFDNYHIAKIRMSGIGNFVQGQPPVQVVVQQPNDQSSTQPQKAPSKFKMWAIIGVVILIIMLIIFLVFGNGGGSSNRGGSKFTSVVKSKNTNGGTNDPEVDSMVAAINNYHHV